MQRKRSLTSTMTVAAVAAASLSATLAATAAPQDGPPPRPEFPPFAEVAKDYQKVTSTAEGKSFYGLYHNKKENQLLAELPRGFANQKHYIAVTQDSGGIFAGLQGPAIYGYWKRFGKRLAFIAPELETRSTGEAESKSSVKRLFTDRVVFEAPIITMGPSGQPVIDLDQVLVRNGGGMGLNARLQRITKAKAFPQNIEIGIEAPGPGGKFAGYHFSISNIKGDPSYKPREADERIGYFTTVYRDLGEYQQKDKWKRYINRWHVEKRDPKLNMSPPKKPIIYYIEHTVPVRYRRYVRDGVLSWNKAFENIGIDGAIEVQFQDKATGAHMEKDPEDVRYNFIRWLNNDISTAIGPSRAHPETGQILDADVVLTDGWIRAYWGWFHEDAPELAVQGLSAETLEWLEDYPQWDPRLLLSSPEKRKSILAQRAERNRRIAAGETVDSLPSDASLMFSPEQVRIAKWVGGEHRHCMAAHHKAYDMAFASIALNSLDMMPEFNGEFPSDGDVLDGIPDWFISQMVHELVCHEVGHTLGLRHNFKSSSIYTLAEINSEAHRGNKTIGGSVMDYLPPNFNMESGEVQGDFAMIDIGPYDEWAIEYGYTFGDTKEVLKRVAEPELVYLSDDDTTGPDPLARRYDFSKNPIEYAHNQMRIVRQQRSTLLDKLVEDGESWSNARRGYQVGLSMQNRMLGMMANWIGGAYVSRARKGDPNAGAPVTVVEPSKQREAMQWVIEHTFNDEAFGLTPELVAHMTVDKWTDNSQGDRSDPTWPVHDRVKGMQQTALTQIMNPTTLKRVLDNEFRTPADEDALTLPEVMDTLYNSVYTELGTKLNGETFTNRKPLISSLRRNLQSGMTDRLIVLSDSTAGLPEAIRTLSLYNLRKLNKTLESLLDKADSGQLDQYTLAHLEDLNDRVTKALNRVKVSN